MKKWIALLLVAGIAVSTAVAEEAEEQAAEAAGVSKEAYVAERKAAAEKKGAAFDQAKAEAQFDKLDKNQDGVLTADEQPQKGKAKAKGKAKGKPVSKETYVAERKAAAEKKGVPFDQAKAEAQFDKLDKNQDGLLTPDEMPQKKGKAKAKGKKKAKPAAEAAGE